MANPTPNNNAYVPETEVVPVSDLRPHPRNYRNHPQAQLNHLAASLVQHGWYRNVVTAEDGTILAGHGIVEAAKLAGLKEAPIYRLPVAPDSTQALKILASDNEIGRFAESDDRALTELLREVMDTDIEGLLGTGFDEMQLAALAMVTRPASELSDFDEAAEWVGLPEYDSDAPQYRLVVNFNSDEDRVRFVDKHRIEGGIRKSDRTWTMKWPEQRDDVKNLHFRAAASVPSDTPADTPAKSAAKKPAKKRQTKRSNEGKV